MRILNRIFCYPSKISIIYDCVDQCRITGYRGGCAFCSISLRSDEEDTYPHTLLISGRWRLFFLPGIFVFLRSNRGKYVSDWARSWSMFILKTYSLIFTKQTPTWVIQIQIQIQNYFVQKNTHMNRKITQANTIESFTELE